MQRATRNRRNSEGRLAARWQHSSVVGRAAEEVRSVAACYFPPRRVLCVVVVLVVRRAKSVRIGTAFGPAMTDYVSDPAHLYEADPQLTARIINQMKSKGSFDQLRKEILADIDTKVSEFLQTFARISLLSCTSD